MTHSGIQEALRCEPEALKRATSRCCANFALYLDGLGLLREPPIQREVRTKLFPLEIRRVVRPYGKNRALFEVFSVPRTEGFAKQPP